MRHIALTIFFLTSALVAAIAQPTVSFEDDTACTGESFCIPVTVDDFSNITAIEFHIEYDPAVLRFDNATNFNTDMVTDGGLGAGNFTETEPGIIAFTGWNTGDCNTTMSLPVTVADDDTIFDLCFTAIGSYGDVTEIKIARTPFPVCYRQATRCTNVGVLTPEAVSKVSLCVREFVTTATPVSGNEGDQICMDFVVEGFDALSGIQYTVNYDPTFLQYESLNPNTNIPANGLSSVYGTPDRIMAGPGNITVSWAGPADTPTSVPDGTTMYTVCFTIIGDCENTTTVVFGETPTEQEVNNLDPANPDEQSDVPFNLVAGTVTVNECDPTGIELIIDCGSPANINDIITVNVLAGTNFDAVRELNYLMRWNTNILEFVDVTDPLNNLTGLDAGDFDQTNVGNGVLGLGWRSNPVPPQNLTNNEVIYQVRFQVVGLGGDSPVQILTPGVGISNGTNIGINPSNCVVEVIQPGSVGVEFGDLDVPLNESGCLPVTVTNFTDVTEFNFTMLWNEGLWQAPTVQNINPLLTNANNGNFTPFGLASLIFEWDNSGTGVTIPDGTTIFELCFQTTTTAMPGECGDLITVALPIIETAVTENSNGENVGLVVNSAEMCILFPEGFGLTVGSANVDWRDTFCIPFTVESFDNITAADFNILWDPLQLEFVEANGMAWTGLALNAPAPTGTIMASFLDTQPLAIPDGGTAFEVCFQAIGPPNECYDIAIQSDPLPSVSTTNGDGSIVITNGEVCVEERIVIRDISITPTTCPNSCDGAISIEIFEWPGQGFIGTTWETEPIQQFTPLMVDELCAGRVIFTIFDNSSGVTLTDTVFVEAGGEVPTVEIRGLDTLEIGCNGLLPLNVENCNPDDSYVWYLNSTSAPPFADGCSVFVENAGNVIIDCINNQGCVGSDTTTVILTEGIDVIIPDPPSPGITCTNSEVILNSIVEGTDTPLYTWSTQLGGPIDETTVNSPSLRVLGSGRYQLEVLDASTGCSDIAIVVVGDDSIIPDACLDADSIDGDTSAEQDCNGAELTFNASCSANNGLDVTYSWLDNMGNPAGDNQLSNSFSELGTYTLVVTEMTTGCTDTAFAAIVPNTSAPQLSLAEVPAFDCNTDSLILAASVTPTIPNLDIQWILADGATLRPGTETELIATALSPGGYQILVTNPADNCQSNAEVIIEDQTIPPSAMINNTTATIDCSNTTLLLNGRDSESGDGIVYQWYEAGEPETIIAGPEGTRDSLLVNDGATYILEVINSNTGCSQRDSITVTENFESLTIIPNTTEPFQLTCDVDTAEFNIEVQILQDGNLVPAVQNVDYRIVDWFTADGNIRSFSPDSLTVVGDQDGTYIVQIISLVSGCITNSDFVVELDRNNPSINVVNDTLSLTCANQFVTMSGAGSATGSNMIYRWEDSEGNEISTEIQTDATMADTYRFSVTNTTNNCSVDTLVVVMADTLRPIVSIDPVMDITCADMMREVVADVSNISNFTVRWENLDPDGTATTPTVGANVNVTDTGTYQATVVNSDNGCESTATVTVDGDVTPPAINLSALPTFDCDTEMVTIDASGSGDASDFTTIIWSPLDGGTITPTDLMATVQDTGRYQLTLVSAANGCTADSIFTIGVVDNPSIPDVVLSNTIAAFGCDGEPVVIDISGTGTIDDFVSIVWTSANTGNTVNDSNPLMVSVDGAGDYSVAITIPGPLGCIAEETFTVEPDEETPVADAGASFDIECNEVTQLDGSNSSTGANFAYAWIQADGSTPLTGDVNGTTPTVEGPGSYQIVVRNVDNGCIDTSGVVTVTLVFPGDADAGFDQIVCDSAGILDAIAVMGAQGVWTTTDGAVIDFENDPATNVGDLAEGDNTFTWTLSAPGCPDYSTDDVTITRSTAPIAFDDQLEVLQGETAPVVNVLDNDQFSGASDVTVRLIKGPDFGTIDTAALATGQLIYTYELFDVGVTEVEYEICSVNCPDLCASATVVIGITENGETFIPNTITPNGDGDNEVLIFDVIRLNPVDEFPDNELIIFNRWGDIIYEAKPYNNDWNGLNNNGEEVVEGTYYYILRLDISNGDIVRGDVTIIR